MLNKIAISILGGLMSYAGVSLIFSEWKHLILACLLVVLLAVIVLVWESYKRTPANVQEFIDECKSLTKELKSLNSGDGQCADKS